MKLLIEISKEELELFCKHKEQVTEEPIEEEQEEEESFEEYSKRIRQQVKDALEALKQAQDSPSTLTTLNDLIQEQLAKREREG